MMIDDDWFWGVGWMGMSVVVFDDGTDRDWIGIRFGLGLELRERVLLFRKGRCVCVYGRKERRKEKKKILVTLHSSRNR